MGSHGTLGLCMDITSHWQLSLKCSRYLNVYFHFAYFVELILWLIVSGWALIMSIPLCKAGTLCRHKRAALTGHFAHAENLNKVEILFTKIFVPLSRKYLVLKTDKHVVSQRYRPATSSSWNVYHMTHWIFQFRFHLDIRVVLPTASSETRG